MPKHNMLQVVAHYDEPYKADIAQAKLVANGINAQIFDQTVASWNPFLTKAIGGISVMVPSRDLSKARKVLGKM
jgi:hypothetical protein